MNQSGGSGGDKGNFQKIGEGVGGLFGQAADMGANFLNQVLGQGAKSMGGWWAQAGEQGSSTSRFGESEDNECRRHFEASMKGGSAGGGGMHAEAEIHAEGPSSSGGSAGGGSGSAPGGAASGSGPAGASGSATGGASGRSYETVRPLYQFGHLAGQNPDYQSRSFEEIEPELRRGWGEEQSQRFGHWPEVRSHVEFGYSQGSRRGGGGGDR